MASEETKRYLAKYSKKERALNWLAYHKWWLALGAAAVAAAVWAVAASMARVVPDYQVAVVGESALPADAAEALERALAGFGEDLNGDGRVVVRVADYPLAGPEDATQRTVLETRLMADLMAGESCLFLLADPDGFQQRYQALAESVRACKPHREIFDEALRVSGLSAREVIHVGDSIISDVNGARTAGIAPVLLDRTGTQNCGDAVVVSSLRALTRLLNGEIVV